MDRVVNLKVNGTAAPILAVAANGGGDPGSPLVKLHPDREALLDLLWI